MDVSIFSAHLRHNLKTASLRSWAANAGRNRVWQPLSTTEDTEAAFAGTEAVGERKPKRLFNHYATPPTCERFEHFSPRTHLGQIFDLTLPLGKSSNRSRWVFENREARRLDATRRMSTFGYALKFTSNPARFDARPDRYLIHTILKYLPRAI